MRKNTILEKYIKNKQTYYVYKDYSVMSRDRNCLLSNQVNNYQDSVKSRG